MKALKVVSIVLAVLVIAALGFVYGGIFNVAADDPHWGLTQRVLEAVRERSVATRATGLTVPSLDDPNLIAMGAEHYSEMCTGCHLAPGQEDTELRAGLYPKPPNLAEHGLHGSPQQTFWIIKHGYKMTGMPAWGNTHDDQSIWGMVAFLRKLPELSPTKYQELIEAGGEGHHHDSEGHSPAADTEESGHSHGDALMPQQPQEAKGHSHGEKGQDHQHGEANTKDKEASHDHEKQKAKVSGHDHSTHSHETTPMASPSAGAPLPASTMEPVAAVDRFFRALASSDVQSASRMLDPAVLIYESGGAERSREEYASHHLGSDAAFLKSAKHRLLSRTGDAVGDLAWVATESRLTAQGAKPSDVISTETMVLRKTNEGWRIVHIHWSSRPAKT